jgi:hypothetical protein
LVAQFTYITRGQALAELSVRLEDTGMVFWVSHELDLYLFEALQIWNCLTQWWTQKYTVALIPPVVSTWQSTNVAGSPRQRSTPDIAAYQYMEFHLLEPATGGTWTGTSQFAIDDLAQAVMRRQDEVLQTTACNMAEIVLSVTPNTSRAIMPDSVLDVKRVRYIPVVGSPATLERSDTLAYQRFSPSYQQTSKDPLRWDVLSGPPLTLTLDTLIPVPNTLQILAMEAGTPVAPPASTVLQVPSDWLWVVKYGALYDVLSKENEGKDQERANYCRQRYVEGLQLMIEMPWCLQAWVNEFPVDVVSLAAADRFNYEWQARSTAYPALVVGGIDLWALAPTPTSITGVSMLLVANAPLPISDTDLIQVPRDVMDAILDEAQHLAAFKHGGLEFSETIALHQSFIETAKRWNSRLRESGIFPTDLRPLHQRQFEQQPRYAAEGARNA